MPQIRFSEFNLWKKQKSKNRNLASFSLEVTSRCNNNCRHCCINMPVNDKKAEAREMTFEQIKGIVDQAANMGALSCVITGGEPLLRNDFFDIYLYLKRKGISITVFTNATIITDKHIKLFKKYPPLSVEVTVYGATKETYENLTRRSGSFKAFMHGVRLLLRNKINVRLKTMVTRSNIHELSKIKRFCRLSPGDDFFFDPIVNLRFDRDKKKNREIQKQRLSPEEIKEIEKKYSTQSQVWGSNADKNLIPKRFRYDNTRLFRFPCGDGTFSVSYDGKFKLCRILVVPKFMYDLKKGTVWEAYTKFAPWVQSLSSKNKRCRTCSLIDVCFHCPAQSYLETGSIDIPSEYCCSIVRTAHGT